MQNKAAYTTVFLLGISIGAVGAERMVTSKMSAMMDERSAELSDARNKLKTANDTINLLTSKSTVLYEDAPAGVDVMHGLARIQAGRELGGTLLAQRTVKWVIPFAIRPLAAPSTPGAAYAYVDKTSGQVSAVIPALRTGGQ